MKILRFATFASAGAVLLAASTRASAQTADDAMAQAARDLVVQGGRAAAAKEWEVCRAKLLAAWALKKDAPTAAQLGECELKAGHPRDAAEHLQSFLDSAPASTAPELRTRAEASLGEAKAKIAIVSVTAPLPGTEITLDGKPMGKAPLTVYLDPGHYTFESKE